MQETHFLKQGGNGSALGISNSCDQPIFKQRAVTALKPGRIPLHMQEKCTKFVPLRA